MSRRYHGTAFYSIGCCMSATQNVRFHTPQLAVYSLLTCGIIFLFFVLRPTLYNVTSHPSSPDTQCGHVTCHMSHHVTAARCVAAAHLCLAASLCSVSAVMKVAAPLRPLHTIPPALSLLLHISVFLPNSNAHPAPAAIVRCGCSSGGRARIGRAPLRGGCGGGGGCRGCGSWGCRVANTE